MHMADRLCVISGGKQQQVGTPLEIRTYPANPHVAEFMAEP